MQNDCLHPEISDVHFWLSHKFNTTQRPKAPIDLRHETIDLVVQHFEGQESAHDSNDASLAAILISAVARFPSN